MRIGKHMSDACMASRQAVSIAYLENYFGVNCGE
jgi:hypothetical protein